MRVFIAVLLILLFAGQVLPFTALGKTAVKTQISICDDEVPCDDGDGDNSAPDASKLKKGSPLLEDYVLHQRAHASALCGEQAARLLLLHGADHLPIRYAAEVTTPPPDFS